LVVRGVLATVVAGLLSAGSVAPAAAGDTCANAAVRAQTGATGLPDCRAYEMVSPPYKEGFPVDLGKSGYTDDGIVTYTSTGSFADNADGMLLAMSYASTRAGAGWVTKAFGPPDPIYNTGTTGNYAQSVDLRRSLWTMTPRSAPAEAFGFWLRGSDGAFTRIGDAETSVASRPFIRLVSDDLSHIVFDYGTPDTTGNPVTRLWEHAGTGNGAPRLVSVDNNGQPTASNTAPSDMSGDGRVIVFVANRDGVRQVWARINGSVSVAVSRSECTRASDDPGGACNGASAAYYAGAADDGSRVFFTTDQQLVNGDIDQTSDLYACDIPAGVPVPVGSANPCASLRQVSGTGADAQVENVVAVSDDGSRVYFVAQGVLADNLGIGAGEIGDVSAAAGRHNLYLWERDGAHPAGQTRFVARLVDNDLTEPLITKAEMTPDGRYLLFVTGNRLVMGGPSADEDNNVADVYRYDASTGMMVRVSTSVAGGGGNGDFAASTGRTSASSGPPSSSMTSDGSTVIFGTGEALSRDDTNGAGDVYSWRDGDVSLISTAGGGAPWGITPSGRDIFFTTSSPVLAADGDLITDIYTARAGGGFEQPRTPDPCSGDQCQGQRSQLPPLAGPSAPAFGDPGPGVAESAFSLRAVSAAQRKRLAATGKVSLSVTSNAAGTVGAKATATVGSRTVAVGSAKRTLTGPGRVAVTLTLSKPARAQLARRGRLTVKIAVSHSKVALDRSVTLRLVHAQAKKAKRASGGRS
jgi:hypothetical protein